MRHTIPRPTFDTLRMVEDLAAKGWRPADLARRANVPRMRVTRFLRGDYQTAPTAAQLARALGYPVARYLCRRPRQRRVAA
jgi:hypothetical protein